MNNRNIILTAADRARLERLIACASNVSERTRGELKALRKELDRAETVASEEIPPDVITMNIRAELLDLDSGNCEAFTLIFPSEANIDDGKISVLAPLGTAMLGYRVGDESE